MKCPKEAYLLNETNYSSLSPRKITLACIIIVLVFVVIDLFTQFARYNTFDFPLRFRVDRLFHLGREANIPTWFSTVLLLFAAVLRGFIANAKFKACEHYRYHWLVLSLIFVYLSMDEAAILHEEIGDLLGSILPGTLFRYGWVTVGIPGAAFFAISYYRFLDSLPSRTKQLIFTAGIIFVIGAIGFEILAMPYENGRAGDFGFSILVAIEELLEMLGIILFNFALMELISSTMNGIEPIRSK